MLAKNLFFSGGTVLIDHGYGLYTMYAHLSKMRAKASQDVHVGDVIAESGMTGRVSGPHLHWGAIVHGQKVNPADLLKVLK